MATVIRVLVIKPGFGGGTNGARYKMLLGDGHFSVFMPDVPEPTRGEKVDIQTGVSILQNAIRTTKPDMIVAASRGNI